MKTCRSKRPVERVRGNEGQALAEFAITLPVLACVLVFCARAWKAEWDRADCAWRAFSLAHARMAREEGEGGRIEVDLRCGDAHEQVALWKLEAVKW